MSYTKINIGQRQDEIEQRSTAHLSRLFESFLHASYCYPSCVRKECWSEEILTIASVAQRMGKIFSSIE